MADFRTIFPPFSSDLKISHTDRTLCTGSCFAEHMGSRLQKLKFPILLNPFGIVYNPVSISQGFERILSGEKFQLEDLFEHLGLWHSFAHHGSFSLPDRQAALDKINRSLLDARTFLEHANRLIVTLGTANVFVLKKNGTVVANCHKLPGQEFERRRLSVGEVVNALGPVFEKLKELTASPLQIILTVSPVRHLRDGLVENQRSKATLLLAAEELCKTLPNIRYFPSFEILLDDLRDYRFYEEDMAHPNSLAVDYIWQYFEEAFFEEKTRQLCRQIEKILAAANHRPFHPHSAEHRTFLEKQLAAVQEMESVFPHLDFSREKEIFTRQ